MNSRRRLNEVLVRSAHSFMKFLIACPQIVFGLAILEYAKCGCYQVSLYVAETRPNNIKF